jgi:hypothetical protein
VFCAWASINAHICGLVGFRILVVGGADELSLLGIDINNKLNNIYNIYKYKYAYIYICTGKGVSKIVPST